MSETLPNPGPIIGLPEMGEDTTFAFSQVLTCESRLEGAITLDTLWNETLAASPSINLVVDSVIDVVRSELLYREEMFVMGNLDLAVHGFKLAVGLVMYSEYFQSGSPGVFEAYVADGVGRNTLPVMTNNELESVSAHILGRSKHEQSFIDEDDDGTDRLSLFSISSRDADGLFDFAPELSPMVFWYYCNNADPLLELSDPEFYAFEEESLRSSFYYGFEQALEMFVQSYEARALEPHEKQFADIDTSGLDAA